MNKESTARIVSRVSLGSLAGFMGQGINILRQLVLIPLFLSVWTASLYGEWLALYAAISYLALMDFGMQLYVVNRLNQSYSAGQLNEYTRILHSALRLYLSIVTIAACIIAIGIFALPIEQWLNFKIMNHFTFSLVALLLGARLIFGIPKGLITGLYRTIREFPREATIRNLQRFSMVSLTALVLLLGGGVIHVAAAELIPFVGVIAFVVFDLKKRHPEVRIGLQEADWRLAFTFLGPSLLFFLIQISYGLTIQGSIIVVSVFVGSTSVATFAVHRTLTNLIRQSIGFFCSALWPELTTLEARKDYNKLRIVHRLSVKLMFAASVIIGIWLHFAGKDIIRLWTLNKITFDQILFDFFLVYLIVQTPYSTSGTFLAAFNRHKNVCICTILSSVLGLGLALILVRSFGLVGIVAGLLISDILVCSWFIPLNTCRVIGDNIGKFFSSILILGLPIIAAEWILGWFLSQLNLSAIFFIVISGFCLISTGVVLGWIFWLNGQERLQLLSLKRVFLNKDAS